MSDLSGLERLLKQLTPAQRLEFAEVQVLALSDFPEWQDIEMYWAGYADALRNTLAGLDSPAITGEQIAAIEARDLVDVLKRMKDAVPRDEVLLSGVLADLYMSVSFAAPEMMPMWWRLTSEALSGHLPSESEELVDWQKRVAEIFTGQEIALQTKGVRLSDIENEPEEPGPILAVCPCCKFETAMFVPASNACWNCVAAGCHVDGHCRLPENKQQHAGQGKEESYGRQNQD